jgi:hypothetical protein
MYKMPNGEVHVFSGDREDHHCTMANITRKRIKAGSRHPLLAKRNHMHVISINVAAGYFKECPVGGGLYGLYLCLRGEFSVIDQSLSPLPTYAFWDDGLPVYSVYSAFPGSERHKYCHRMQIAPGNVAL